MPEWFRDAFHDAFQFNAEISAMVVAFRLAAALALGSIVAGVYRLTHGKPGGQSLSLMATLVMLTVLIAMVTLVIGESQARAFSLVGALAIIRFRTVVEDTRDTAFVIFAVAVGMASGTGNVGVALVGIPIAAVAAFLFRRRIESAAHIDYLLTVRIGAGQEPDALLGTPFAKHLSQHHLQATVTARQGAAFEVTYAVRLQQPDGAFALVADLNGIEGVQNVELKQANA